jgi:hypothetical protein
MAVRKAAKKKARKTAKRSAAPKRTAKASPGRQKELRAGSSYACSTCGLVVTVDEVCGCVDFCDIICCGEQMKPA